MRFPWSKPRPPRNFPRCECDRCAPLWLDMNRDILQIMHGPNTTPRYWLDGDNEYGGCWITTAHRPLPEGHGPLYTR